jgi:hypothetical protein
MLNMMKTTSLTYLSSSAMPASHNEDTQYLAEARREPYLAKGLQCSGYGDATKLVKNVLDKHSRAKPSASPFTSPV